MRKQDSRVRSKISDGTPFFNRAWAILSLCLSFLLVTQGNVEGAKALSTAELQGLFEMAITNRPQRIRMVADVTLKEPAWTAEQVAAEVQRQNEGMAENDKLLNPKQRADLQLARSNAVVGVHLGRRLIHVQEWYSGRKYRLDMREESPNGRSNQGTESRPYQHTFVNIHDPAFSPYESFSVNHALRDALLTKNPGASWAPYDIWQALGLDEELVVPILLALVDLRSVDYCKPGALWEREQLKFDLHKAMAFQSFSEPNWHFEQDTSVLDQVPVSRIKVTGKLPGLDGADDPNAMPAMCLVQAEYWLGECSGRTVCLQAMLTNLTKQTSFFSRREAFDSRGYPKRWSTVRTESGFTKTEQIVELKEVDTVAAFSDEQVFAPHFPTNYTVSDLTAGKGVTLQLPHLDIGEVRNGRKMTNRFPVLVVLGFVSIGPLVVLLWLRLKRKF